MLFTFHWQVGVGPPFIGVAENVTLETGQEGFNDVKIVTEGITENI